MPEIDSEVQEIIDAHPACTTAPNGTGRRCACVADCANYWLRVKGFRDLPELSVQPELPPMPRVRDFQAIIVISAWGWSVLAMVSLSLGLAFGPVLFYVALGCAIAAVLLYVAAIVNAIINS